LHSTPSTHKGFLRNVLWLCLANAHAAQKAEQGPLKMRHHFGKRFAFAGGDALQDSVHIQQQPLTRRDGTAAGKLLCRVVQYRYFM
jgi:hypothetical protein